MDKLEIEKNVLNWAQNNFGKDFKFREHQLDVIVNIIYTKLSDEYNPTHQIIQAPTGSGKSLINIISAGVLYSIYNIPSYILCSDLYLYKQYVDFIDKYALQDFGYLKGQTGNYVCPKSNCDVRCAECKIKSLSYSKLFSNDAKVNPCKYAMKNECEYIEERKIAINSGVTLMTYQLYHFQMNVCTSKYDSHGILINGQFNYRPLIFCDECHNIPSIIQNRCRPVICKNDGTNMYKIYKYYKDVKTKPEFKQYVRQIKSKLMDLYNNSEDLIKEFNVQYNKMKDSNLDSYNNTIALLNYEAKFVRPITYVANSLSNYMKQKLNKGFKLSSKDWEIFNLIAWLQNYHCYLDDFNMAIKNTGFVYTIKQVQSNGYITFSCIKEDGMIAAFLLSHDVQQLNKIHYNSTVLTSATCGNIDSFIENMGYKHINATPKFYDLDSTFDFSTSPIYIYDKLKMSFAKKKENFSAMKSIITNIIRKHKNENGIIQTGSYDNAHKLYKLLDENIKKRILIYKSASEKTELIQKIKDNTNYVLIGPTLNEGIDLPGNLCKFIIIMKIPYLSIADKYVSAKMKMFKSWYYNVAATNLIQGIGRGNRFINDSCTTYILDGCFKRMFSRTKKQFPKYLTNRFIYIDNEYDLYKKQSKRLKIAA